MWPQIIVICRSTPSPIESPKGRDHGSLFPTDINPDNLSRELTRSTLSPWMMRILLPENMTRDQASGRLREDLCGDVTQRTLTPRVSRNPSYGGILPPKDLAMDLVSRKKKDRGSFREILPDKWF